MERQTNAQQRRESQAGMREAIPDWQELIETSLRITKAVLPWTSLCRTEFIPLFTL